MLFAKWKKKIHWCILKYLQIWAEQKRPETVQHFLLFSLETVDKWMIIYYAHKNIKINPPKNFICMLAQVVEGWGA